LLTYLGALHAEEPYVVITQISTAFYFSYFIFFLPILGLVENKALRFWA
jgi:ubiquinol-cytochrome c reductase cytochrome b subunit